MQKSCSEREHDRIRAQKKASVVEREMRVRGARDETGEAEDGES